MMPHGGGMRPLSRIAAALLLLLPPLAQAEGKWEKEVAEVEARVAQNAPETGRIFFAGSSSARLWDLEKSFPTLGAVNVGFGGSRIPDSTRFAARLLTRWQPSCVALYAGDNDIAGGVSPEQVAQDFIEFATTIHAQAPECRILFLSIKPSESRWKLWPKAQQANEQIRRLCETLSAKHLRYVDLATALLGPDGKPRAEFFRNDKLHLNEAGYAAWTAALAPHLAKK